MKFCKQCTKEFETTETQREFYTKIHVPEPTLCPACRQQRRLAWRNERSLYPRKCALTGKDILSIYAPERPWPVYSSESWYGDEWDQLATGRDFDFSRPFFEQYKELQTAAPHLGAITVNNENSPYVNQAWHNKNCHMCFDLGYCESCLYCSATYHSKDSSDANFTHESELCYETVGCTKCFRGVFLEDCHNCSDVSFSFDCKNCSNCMLCSNLRNKQYCILNTQYTKDEYEKEKEKYIVRSYAAFQELKKRFSDVKQKAIHRSSLNFQCQDCHGDYLNRSKNMKLCFDCDSAENCSYVTRIDSDVKDSMDVDHAAENELMYEGVAMCGFNSRFGYNVVHCQNVDYSEVMISCTNCFGCAHLHNQEYCILNKKYSKEEYESLNVKIIDHMKQTGEWGQYFPPTVAPYSYNETTANEFYPLTREEALTKGFQWKDDIFRTTGKETIKESDIPDVLSDESATCLIGQVIACTQCAKNYRYTKQELGLYGRIGVPAPRQCYDCRHMRRFKARNPRILYKRACMNQGCANEFETTYAPNRPERVYCESCYQQNIA